MPPAAQTNLTIVESSDNRLFAVMPYRRAAIRAWRLAWSARSPQRSRDAWWLCWRLADRAGGRCSSPGGAYLPAVPSIIPGKPHAAALWLLPPGSPFRSVPA